MVAALCSTAFGGTHAPIASTSDASSTSTIRAAARAVAERRTVIERKRNCARHREQLEPFTDDGVPVHATSAETGRHGFGRSVHERGTSSVTPRCGASPECRRAADDQRGVRGRHYEFAIAHCRDQRELRVSAKPMRMRGAMRGFGCTEQHAHIRCGRQARSAHRN